MKSTCLAVALCASASTLSAQWASIPWVPVNGVAKGANLITHTNGNGIQAFSAITQQWTTVSPASATFLGSGDSYVLTRESSNLVRGWSARWNASATLTVDSSALLFNGGGEVVLLIDQSVTPFVMHAYSAMTNAWSDLTFAPNISYVTVSRFAAAVLEGNFYRGFSAYTGQWTTLAVGAPGANPVSNDNIVTADLFSAGVGVRQIAAYSAIRGTWQLSPPYSSTIGAGIQRTDNLASMKAALAIPTQYSFAGFSARTGQWVTSSLVHNTTSTVSATGFHNVVAVTDNDPAARFEMFGAGSGQWLSLTGTTLTNETIREDFVTITDSATQTLYAASGLAGGGWATQTGGYSCTTGGDHLGLCVATGPIRYKAYSAANNTFSPGTVAAPALNASAVATNGVAGIIGSGPFTVQAFGALSNDWVPGPAIPAGQTWGSLTTGTMYVAYEGNIATGYTIHAFDSHRQAWIAPLLLPPSYNLAVSANAILAWPGSGSGTIYGYSAQRGDWSTLTTAGDFMTVGGAAAPFSNVLTFGDSNGQLWAFSTTDEMQSNTQWPLSREYASAGPGPSGSALPTLAFTMRGQPGTELALVFASFGLVPSPIAIPGFGGLLDLDPGTVFSLANLGVFGASGVLGATLPLAGAVPGGVQLWLQPVALDLITFQFRFGGRAAGTHVF